MHFIFVAHWNHTQSIYIKINIDFLGFLQISTDFYGFLGTQGPNKNP